MKTGFSRFCQSYWSRDPGLRACGYAAKGLWMDMLCQMDASDEVGFLVIAGRPATVTEIAKLVGGDRRAVGRLVVELEANGVFSRDERGAIYSRNLARRTVS